MTIENILTAKQCGDIFVKADLQELKRQYHQLLLNYHPDVCKDDKAKYAVQIITDLYNQAQDCVKNGVWYATNTVYVDRHTIQYKYTYQFELGTCYVCDNCVWYAFDKEYENFFNNAVKHIDKDMTAFTDSSFLKMLMSKSKAAFNYNDTYYIQVDKPNDFYPLSLVLNAYDGHIPDRHVAWVMTKLLNVCMILKENNVVHNGIIIDNCYISPSQHLVRVIGGWQYACTVGEKMLGTVPDVYNVMRIKTKQNKTACFATDVDSVKQIGRKLIDHSTAPKPILNWLNAVSMNDTMADFTAWDIALKSAYGARKFVEMNITSNDVYK